MRVRDGDRVINSACAGRRISPIMLISPFTEFTEGHRYSFNSTYCCASSMCYAWLVIMQLTRDLFAITKFLFSNGLTPSPHLNWL